MDREPCRRPAGLPWLRTASGGFTLLEVVIVVTVLAIVVGVALPRLPDVGGARIYRNARKVGNALMLARSRAVSLRRYYRLDLDLEESRISLSYFGPEGIFIEDVEVRPVVLSESYMTDVVTGRSGKTLEGEGTIHISPRGQIEPSLVHLGDDRGRVLTVMPAPFGGRVVVSEGYLDLGARQ